MGFPILPEHYGNYSPSGLADARTCSLLSV